MEILKNILIVGAGSFIGGAARYIMMTVMSGIKKGWPTVAVNLIGCLLIGLIWGFTAYVCTSVIAGIAVTAIGYYLTR